MKFYILTLLTLSTVSFSKVSDVNIKGKFVVTGLYGAVVCKDREIILKKFLPLPCEVTTGKNSFLELTGDLKEKVIVGASSTVTINENLLRILKGSMRIEGERTIKVSAYNYNVSRQSGKQLFFSSEIFSDLELLSLKGELVFEEKIKEGDTEKTVMTSVPENSWVSVGGRFGDELGDFYELSKAQVKYFSEFLLPQLSESERRE